MMKNRTQITDEIVLQAETLASKGIATTLIADSLGIAVSTTRCNDDIKEAIQRGRKIIRDKIVDDLIRRSEKDTTPTATIYLANKLKVYDDYFTTSKPKTIAEAIDRIADIYTAVSNNELSSEKADRLINYLNTYLKAYELGLERKNRKSIDFE